MTQKPRAIYFLSVILALFISSSTLANEKQLLSDAIGYIQSVTADLSTKDKLNNYEQALDALSEIESQYAATDTAITLKTNQNIGDFSVTKIREDYLKELFGYYDTVCEKSPSYLCLGFVSLKAGIEECKAGATLDNLESAQMSLLNSIRIFRGQKAKSTYSNMAITQYRNCANEYFDKESQEWNRGFYTLALVKTLLDVGDEKTARGIIENTKEPYFKLESALYLKRTSGETPDSDYEERLNQYIDKKLTEPNMGLANLLGKISLAKLMLDKGNDYYTTLKPIKTTGTYDNQFDFNQFQFGCGEGTLEYVHEELMDYLISRYSSGIDRMSIRGELGFVGNHINKLANYFGEMQDKCRTSAFDKGFYFLTMRALGDILLFAQEPGSPPPSYKGPKANNAIQEAIKFKQFVFNEAEGSVRKVFDYYVDYLVKDNSIELKVELPFICSELNWDSIEKDFTSALMWIELDEKADCDIFREFTSRHILNRMAGSVHFGKSYTGYRPYDELIEHMDNMNELLYLERFLTGKITQGNNWEQISPSNSLGNYGTYRVFKEYVNFADVCNASRVLFQNLKDTEYFQVAVDYIVSSPNTKPNETHDCGDEDLELLLM